MATQFDLEPYRTAFEKLCSDYAVGDSAPSAASKFERTEQGIYKNTAVQAAWWGYQEGLKAAIEQTEPPLPAIWPEDLSLYGEYLGTNIGQSTH
jgi:hypothetical protein